MSDKEFIIFLCTELWGHATDGNEIDFEKIEKELRIRGIDPEIVFGY